MKKVNPMAPNNKRPNQNEFAFKSLLLMTTFVLLLGTVFFHCSKSSSDEENSTPLNPPRRSPVPVLAEIKLEPEEATAGEPIRANPVLEKKPLMGRVTYQYRWFINGDPVEAHNKKILPKDFINKNDDVFCRVTAYRGSYISTPLNSKKITIANAAPVLNLAQVKPFTVPGRFEYVIAAYDPDGDPLTYHLLEPLEQGIDIDPQLGRITWDIDRIPTDAQDVQDQQLNPEDETAGAVTNKKKEENEPQLYSVVTIRFEVRDDEGAAIQGSLTLNLAKGKELPE